MARIGGARTRGKGGTFGSTFAEALDMGTHVEERLHRKRKTEHAGNGTGNQKIGPPEASQAKRPPSHLDWSAERAPRASWLGERSYAIHGLRAVLRSVR